MNMETGTRDTSIRQPSLHLRVSRAAGKAFSFGLAAAGAFSVAAHAFVEPFHSARLTVVLGLLLILHLGHWPRLAATRELSLYGLFLFYIVITLLWTDDVRLALNTIVPAVNALLLIALFGTLVKYYKVEAVLAGAVFGTMAGAGWYTLTTGFPLNYPADFSYNAIAGMYLFGLFSALLLSCYGKMARLLLLVSASFLALCLATTSIKVNLGILLGAIFASVSYFKYFASSVIRNFVPLTVLLTFVGFGILSTESLVSGLKGGVERVSLGIEILQVRENVAGYSAFEDRLAWLSAGLEGWAKNPLFGHGAEAFRSKFGITSHSTPIDLLFNFGIIGFLLFYSVMASMILRLPRYKGRNVADRGMVILGALVCYLFISLSAPLHYNAYFAIFIAIGSAVLSQGKQARA